jgi:hypothetical protein
MTQYQQVLDAVKKLGGKGTTDEILRATDISNWKTQTPKASVASYLSTSNEFRQEGNVWIYEEGTDGNRNKILLYCSDGVLATAIARFSQNKWTIFGISKVHGFGSADFEKVLFDTTFDDIVEFNSTSGVSYVAVKKENLWGLIRFRLNPEFAYDKKAFEKVIWWGPIDKEAMDSLGREIKLIEDIEYSDIKFFKNKYRLDNLNNFNNDTENNEIPEELKKIRRWSDSLIENTKDSFSNLEFGVGPEGTVRMKRNDGSFGFILFKDAFNKKYNVHHDEDDKIDQYNNTSEMIDDGWVLD